ncbi:MAG: histidine kinase [Pseudonocardiales bacterium]|nr:histidine kinase [Pseudonocardiales bacterium]
MTDTWVGPVDRPLEPLWRGLLVYRGLTLVSAVAVALFHLGEYAHPLGAVAVLAVMVAWTGSTAYLYLVGPVRRRAAVLDLVVTVAVIATTPLVQSTAQIAADAPVMGSIWTPGAAVACALVFGVRGGLVGGVVLAAADLAVSARAATELTDIELILLVSLTVGFASTVVRRSAERTRQAIASEAAMRERERLARAVHDGVLQVLGYVRRRGVELGGPAGELAGLAGEQEFALRALLTTGSAPVDGQGQRDLAAALRVLATSRVSVATPAHAVDLPAHAVDELVAVVKAALANVEVHVGADARAWVLVEDVDPTIEISVRDEGPGIPDGRLAEAAAQGRLGVAQSMRGRVADLGGTIVCDTGQDQGTEWIIRVKRS